MRIPVIEGVIRRRLLLNYRVDPGVVSRLLPTNFTPKIVGGWAIAGICLIRLEVVRPKGFPAILGVSSENSAHRIAVEWAEGEGGSAPRREGVFVPRRDTGSLLNSLGGGRIFPGVHHRSRFEIEDRGGRIAVRVAGGGDGLPLVDVVAREGEDFPRSSAFGSLKESSAFFEAGCVGYSSRPQSCVMDGLRLKVDEWRVSSLQVERIRSAFFDDRVVFPVGSIEFDHALLMRDVPHEWHSERSMTASGAGGSRGEMGAFIRT
ncbi:MAG: DUF2071 domain-containing protein [Chthoniobacterales bacterium]